MKAIEEEEEEEEEEDEVENEDEDEKTNVFSGTMGKKQRKTRTNNRNEQKGNETTEISHMQILPKTMSECRGSGHTYKTNGQK